jgi:hypothetical protein
MPISSNKQIQLANFEQQLTSTIKTRATPEKLLFE